MIHQGRNNERIISIALQRNKNNAETSGFEDSDVASKGIVTSLTRLVNSFASKGDPAAALNDSSNAPQTPFELMERIRDDYTEKNYLWTGDIDLSCFDRRCRFTDPTLSFTGTDQFVKNIGNLRPIVDALIPPNGSKSDLLDIQLVTDQNYIQTRWNMVGNLAALPWKPKIDVIGRTKFWYKHQDDGFVVYFYDEEWEIPAARALLQIITPGGTIPNKSQSAS